MISVIIVVMVYIAILVPIAIVGNVVGEKLEKWLDNHFPNVEE